jgi:pyrimidine deaminase RibD-like protein
MLDSDTEFMQMALQEGRKALPACLPNPPVGCILVRAGTVVARGHTQPPSAPHAEAMALSLLEGSLAEVTAFVTLEPCSFHGKTPSCARALVERGIGRVVVAVLDPDPRNAGAGIQILRSGGVDVSIGVLAEEAIKDLGPFLQ